MPELAAFRPSFCGDIFLLAENFELIFQASYKLVNGETDENRKFIFRS